MKPTERYLKQATRGLWGRARRELRAELAGHLGERVAELRLGNLSADEAERQVLRELGAPEQVSVGMLGVHTVPAVGKTGALGLLMATVLFAALPQGLAQVKGIYSYSQEGGATGYLDFEQFKASIEKAGGKISGPADNATIRLPGVTAPRPSLDTHWWLKPGLTLGGRTYLRADSLITGIRDSGADLRLSGWKNPTLNIGAAKIQLEADDWRVLNSFYQPTVGAGMGYGSDPFRSLEPNGNTGEVAFSGPLAANHIYAMVTATFNDWYNIDADGKKLDGGNIMLMTNINQAQAGAIQFRIDNDASNFKLVSSVAEFKKALEPYRDQTKLHQWSSKNPAPALLLELSGKFGADAFKVVSPRAIKRR
ncbi:permease prefix domain 1-containing protein [Deinococcus sp.]|uniref:permease prefix domain 1-containing protein n=1 Tax=Deinococcus sp. TaxID=47478 RepID=UPI0025CF62AE|nr:permease prefix domain 1-containing protein [Deinococcus sp.]